MSGRSAPGAQRPVSLRLGRAAAYTGLALLGAVVGTAGSLVQGAWFPGGLLLSLLAAAGLFHGSGKLTGTPFGVVASGVGWLGAVLLLSMGRPEGDGVFSAGIGPVVFIIGGMAIAVMCATMTRPAQPGGGTARLDEKGARGTPGKR
ncbi:DUF6113 family protein [Streptomyces sp. NPDC001985]|uniref:DUF6113 family protein n=1 Tax=Streptomyces sp. NPDC001985 TaxID=3154406 RepID=UPI00333113CA